MRSSKFVPISRGIPAALPVAIAHSEFNGIDLGPIGDGTVRDPFGVQGDPLLQVEEPGGGEIAQDDPGKLRAHHLVERLGTSRRYRLTARGLKLGVLLVKLRTRLLGPLASLVSDERPRHPARIISEVEAAFRQVDTALDHLCDTIGLKPAA